MKLRRMPRMKRRSMRRNTQRCKKMKQKHVGTLVNIDRKCNTDLNDLRQMSCTRSSGSRKILIDIYTRSGEWRRGILKAGHCKRQTQINCVLFSRGLGKSWVRKSVTSVILKDNRLVLTEKGLLVYMAGKTGEIWTLEYWKLAMFSLGYTMNQNQNRFIRSYYRPRRPLLRPYLVAD